MAIPKITQKEEEVLLLTGLLDFPLSPLTLQETALLDRPSSPSNCLIPACESLSLAPFTGPSSPKPDVLLSVPANPPIELGSDIPPTHGVPETIAPKLLAQINPYWESLPKVKEVTAPSVIEFKTYGKEELDPSTGKIFHTRVIYPIITPRDKESSCILVPPFSETKGQLNSLVPCPLAAKPVRVDRTSSMTMTPRDPPMPYADQVKPVPDVPMRDVAASDGATSPLHPMPTTPRQSPLLTLCVPFVLPMQSTPGSPRVVMPLQAESPMLVRQSPTSPRTSPNELSQTLSRCSLPGEEAEEEEGQFDNAEEGEIRDLPKLHPSEQPLPPSPSPSPMPSPSPS